MKGRIIEPADDTIEVGNGIDCPNCGGEMLKAMHQSVQVDIDDDSIEVINDPTDSGYECDSCDYREEREHG